MTHSSRLFPQKEANSLSILDRHGLAGFAIQTARLVNLLQHHLSLKMPKKVSLSVKRGEKLPVSKGAGLTAKGRAKYNAATGSNLKPPAPNPKTKADAGRKASFCARMKGVVAKAKGPAERAKASLRRWKCS